MKDPLDKIINSEEELIDIVHFVQNNFPDTKIFTLEGNLGAGKTTFVKTFAKQLGAFDDVSSPTFSIVNQYDGTNTIYHMDLYRLEDSTELYDIGFEEYFDQNAYFFIEWPKIGEELLPPHLRISIEILPDQARKFNFVRVD